MAHKITITRPTGTVITVETDCNEFSVGDTKFKFDVPEVPQPIEARFPIEYGMRGNPNKIRAIKAVRIAGQKMIAETLTSTVELRIAKEIVESGGTFTIFPESIQEFKSFCLAGGLSPIYL